MPEKAKLIPKVGGAYFEFLVIPLEGNPEPLPSGRKRAWTVASYYHHPNALRVKDFVVGLGIWCFEEASAKFGPYGFWGDTEYDGENLSQLIAFLTLHVEMVCTCRRKREFRQLINPFFEAVFLEDIGPWDQYWTRIRDEVVEAFEQILQRAKTAQESGKVLLVMGI